MNSQEGSDSKGAASPKATFGGGCPEVPYREEPLKGLSPAGFPRPQPHRWLGASHRWVKTASRYMHFREGVINMADIGKKTKRGGDEGPPRTRWIR